MLVALGMLLPAGVWAQQPGRCAELDVHQELDFWLGRWVVYEQQQNSPEKPVGENRIEKLLDGCAILEHWRSAAGNEGKSLFYVPPGSADWKQVWVTDHTARIGGTKEKRLVRRFADGGLSFQGQIPSPNGDYLDRTTLTPNSDGSVTQHIEISSDGGDTWTTTFLASYRRAP
jgi:hypothetical protein